MGQIDSGIQARMADFMTFFMPGLFRRWGEKMEALPRPAYSADEQLGGQLAMAAIDLDSTGDAIIDAATGSLTGTLTTQGMPESWGGIVKEEMRAEYARRRTEVYICVGRIYVRHMTSAGLRQTLAFFATPAGQEVARHLRATPTTSP